VVILGDTSESRAILEIGLGADVLVHEATDAVILPDIIDKTGGKYDREGIERLWSEKEAVLVRKGHSSPRMAGAFAKEMKAKKLVLTHFSPRLQYTDYITGAINEAARTFGSQEVEAACDFMRVEI
jgi:ribonuclease Z